MPYRSNLPAAVRKYQRARWVALIAAAELYVGLLKDAHAGGHTTGAFVTGNEMNAIVRLEPETYPGGMLIRITTRQVDPPYPWYWVTGHQNIFTRRFERDDRWTPTLALGAPAVAAEHERVFRREMAA